MKPIGRAIYKDSVSPTKFTLSPKPPAKVEKKEYDPREQVICTECNRKYTKANRAAHRKTKIHLAYAETNAKFRKYLTGID